MAPTLLSTDDVKDSLALGGAVANAPSDTALNRLIVAESAEVLRGGGRSPWGIVRGRPGPPDAHSG